MIKFFVVSYSLFAVAFAAGWFLAILQQTPFGEKVAAICAILFFCFLLLAAAVGIFPDWWF